MLGRGKGAFADRRIRGGYKPLVLLRFSQYARCTCLRYFNFTDKAEALLTLGESLENERTAPTEVGAVSNSLIADKNKDEAEQSDKVFDFIDFGTTTGNRTPVSGVRGQRPDR